MNHAPKESTAEPQSHDYVFRQLREVLVNATKQTLLVCKLCQMLSPLVSALVRAISTANMHPPSASSLEVVGPFPVCLVWLMQVAKRPVCSSPHHYPPHQLLCTPIEGRTWTSSWSQSAGREG
jgi:hypothetical protein